MTGSVRAFGNLALVSLDEQDATEIRIRDRAAMRRAQIMDWRVRVADPMPIDTDVGGVVRAYLAQLEKDQSPSLPDARSVAKLYLLKPFDGIRATELKIAEVVAWVNTLVLDLKLAPKYARKVHGMLRAALELARSRGLIEHNPAARLPPGALPPDETLPEFDAALELLMLEQFCAILSDRRVPLYRRLLWALLGLCGMRLGEACALTLADVDFSIQPLAKITIDKAWSGKNRRIQRTKTNQVRFAPTHQSLVLPLLNEQLEFGFRGMFSRTACPEDLLVAHPSEDTGEPTIYPDSSALRHWKDTLRRHGLAPRRLHSLRHLFDTLLSEAGVDERTIEAITHPPKRERKGVGKYVHKSWQARCDAVSKLKGSIAQMDLFGGSDE